MTKKTMKNNIYLGDRFYYNSHTVSKGLTIPDYFIVTKVSGDIVVAKPENRYIDTRERLFSIDNLWLDSNLNPHASNPSWIFVKENR